MPQRLMSRLKATALCCIVVAAAPQWAIAVSLQVHQVDVSGYPVVKLSVSAIGASGSPIHGLTEKEFAVTDNGVSASELKCRLLKPTGEATAIVLGVDRSGSMRGAAFERVVEAVLEFTRRLGEDDVCAVAPFSSVAGTFSSFSTDEEAVMRFVRDLHPGGDTALYDAVASSSEMLSQRPEHSKALVLLTDGTDTASRITREQALVRARSAGISVYCIGVGPDVDEDALNEIASRTGGLALFTSRPESLVTLYCDLLGVLQSRYELSYRSTQSDVRQRDVRVDLSMGSDRASADGSYIVPSGVGGTTGSGLTLLDGTLIAVLTINLLLMAVVFTKRVRRK